MLKSTVPILAALFLLLPAFAFAGPSAPTVPGSFDDVRNEARKDKKKKDKKKTRRPGKEPATPAEPVDTDGDGIPDENDKCPEDKEDRDAFEDRDGCPDPDNDGDGITDKLDDCPDQAENMDGVDDEDGCPEPPPKIAPIIVDMELLDGTRIKGTVLRIIAVDEDEPDSEDDELDQLNVILDDDSEWPTDWSNVRGMKSEKVKFTEAVDCYSEGVQELGEMTVWECTLKHPTSVTLDKTDSRGKHLFVDRKLRRLDFKMDAETLSCDGGSCETIIEKSAVSLYLYKLISQEKNDDEHAAVTSLQTRLREMQKTQLKTAKFTPAPAPEKAEQKSE